MQEPIRVLILEDHQPAVDGYHYRLERDNFEIVGAVPYGEELLPLLQQQAADVVLLDVEAPVSEDRRDSYPIFDLIVELQQKYPTLKIIIISMHGQRTLVQSALNAGVNGYILKADRAAILDLGNIIRSIMNGGTYLSQQVVDVLADKQKTAVSLSPRQLQILSICATYPEMSQADVARQLSIEHSTVRNSLSSAYSRLEVGSLIEAIAKARSLGIITPYPTPYQQNGKDTVNQR